MRSKFFLITVSSLFWGLNGCNTEETKTISLDKPHLLTDVEKANLKGEVRIVAEKSENEKIKFFDEIGNIQRELLLSTSGVSYYTLNKYASDHKIESSVTKAQGLTTTRTFLYDENGRLIGSKEVSQLEDGSNVGEIYHRFRYDMADRLIEDSSVWGLSSRYFYSDKGLDSVITGGIKYKYLNGNIQSTVTPSESGNVLHSYTYNYDSHGNWVEQSIFKNDERIKTVTRRIIYKDQDISEYEQIYSDFVEGHKGPSTKTITGNVLISKGRITAKPSFENEHWVNCKYCHGTGLEVCLHCSGKGVMKCSRCFGKGIWTWENNKICYECGGRGEKRCDACYGKGNTGSCYHCNGRGQVKE